MKKHVEPEYRLNDPGKVVQGCNGDFEPQNLQPHGPMRPGKSIEDKMPRESRPRVIAAKERRKRSRKG